MACSKHHPEPYPPHHHDHHEHCHGHHEHHHCPHHDDTCGRLTSAARSADSASSSAKAAADSAVLAQKILQNCLTDKTIKPGGGLVYEEGTPPGEGGIIVDVPAIINQGMGLGIDGNGDIYVKLKENGGLAFDENGKIFIRLKEAFGLNWENGQIALRPEELLMPGGGLTIGADGKLVLDVANMDMSRFEALLHALRLPKWLEGDLNLYVNINSDSDSLVSGRGSASLPFKSIQAAVNYACDNFNVGNNTVIINVAAGSYPERVQLNEYSRMNGICKIIGAGIGNTVIARAGGASGFEATRSYWHVENLSIDMESWVAEGIHTAVQAISGASVTIKNVSVLGREVAHGAVFLVGSTDSSTIIIEDGCRFEGRNTSGGTNLVDCFVAGQLGGIRLNWSGAVTISGSFRTITSATDSGVIRRDLIRMGTLSGSPTGQRFTVSSGAGINTQGGGENYFPGSDAGVKGSDSGGWYA